MLRTILFSLAMLIATPVLAHAAISADDEKAIDAKVGSFFTSVQKGDTKGAYDNFMSPTMSEQQQAIRNLIGITDQVVSFFGGPFTYEKVQETELGSRLVFRKYLLQSDKAPYVATMIMYHTSKGWVCQGLYLRDLTQDDFQP